MIEIRRYHREYSSAVKQLHRTVIGTCIGASQCDDLDHIEEVYLKGGEFLMCILDGDLIAIGALKKLSAEVGEIKRMGVHPFSIRRGYGHLLLSRLEGKARHLGYRLIRLSTTSHQIPAIRLFEKSGYREVGREMIGGQESIFYEKDLPAPGLLPQGF